MLKLKQHKSQKEYWATLKVKVVLEDSPFSLSGHDPEGTISGHGNGEQVLVVLPGQKFLRKKIKLTPCK